MATGACTDLTLTEDHLCTDCALVDALEHFIKPLTHTNIKSVNNCQSQMCAQQMICISGNNGNELIVCEPVLLTHAQVNIFNGKVKSCKEGLMWTDVYY